LSNVKLTTKGGGRQKITTGCSKIYI